MSKRTQRLGKATRKPRSILNNRETKEKRERKYFNNKKSKEDKK